MTSASRVVIAAVVATLATACATVPPRCKSEPPAEGRLALDNPDPKYRDYFNTVRERIRSKWVYPREAFERGAEGTTVVTFDIAKDGRLEHVELARSAGTKLLDDAALVAVMLARPLPPVPDSVSAGQMRVSGAFCYQIVPGFTGQTLR